jgi:hypothetical protein
VTGRKALRLPIRDKEGLSKKDSMGLGISASIAFKGLQVKERMLPFPPELIHSGRSKSAIKNEEEKEVLWIWPIGCAGRFTA